MQVKKQKDTLFWIHVYIINHIVNSILSIFHIIITVHLLLIIIITTNIVIRLITKTYGIIIACDIYNNLVMIFNLYPSPLLFKYHYALN